MKDVCNIVQDLLPLYSDEVCSEDSRNLVEEHVKECEACQDFLKKLKKEEACDGVESEDIKELKKIQGKWKRGHKKALIKGFLIAMCICAILSGAIYMAHTHIAIPMKKMEVTKLCQLSDGWNCFHLDVKDDKLLRQVLTTYYGETGEMYLTPQRFLWEKKNKEEDRSVPQYYSHHFFFKLTEEEQTTETMGGRGYDFINIGKDVKKIYLGTEKNHILIWERGMSVPAASEEMETYYKEKMLKMWE